MRGMDLSGQDFRAVDLRSADLRCANLQGADLSFSLLGVSPLRHLQMFMFALLVSLVVGVMSGWAGLYVRGWLNSGIVHEKLLALLLFAMWISFVGMSLFRGIEKAAQHLLPAFAVMTLALVALVRIWNVGSGRGVLSVAFLLLLTAALVAVGAFARALAGIRWQLAFFIVAISGALVAGALGGGALATFIAVAAAVVGHRVLYQPEQHIHFHRTLREVVSRFGTRFDKADLRGASFRAATIRGARFAGARTGGADFADARLSKFQLDPRVVVACNEDQMAETAPPAQ